MIGNWGKRIASDFSITLAEIALAIPRMQRLETPIIRIMSYAQEPWGQDQHEAERFRRLREIVNRFADAGITAIHENCMNWGGFSADHTLRLVEEVPGLKLVFDTGNPVFQRDRSKPEPYPWQDPMEFWLKGEGAYRSTSTSRTASTPSPTTSSRNTPSPAKARPSSAKSSPRPPIRLQGRTRHRAPRRHRFPRPRSLRRRLGSVLRFLRRIRPPVRPPDRHTLADSIQRMNPPQPRVAGETSVEADPFASRLDGERGVVCIRNKIPPDFRFLAQFPENFPM